MSNATMCSQLLRMNVESAMSKIIHLLKGRNCWKILIQLFRSTGVLISSQPDQEEVKRRKVTFPCNFQITRWNVLQIYQALQNLNFAFYGRVLDTIFSPLFSQVRFIDRFRLRDMTPCSPAEVYRRFRGSFCLHHQGRWQISQHRRQQCHSNHRENFFFNR